MLEDSLLDFIRSGLFGPDALGQTRDGPRRRTYALGSLYKIDGSIP